MTPQIISLMLTLKTFYVTSAFYLFELMNSFPGKIAAASKQTGLVSYDIHRSPILWNYRNNRISPNHIYSLMENFKLKNCPASAYYIPDFLTVEEEQFLLKNIYNVPQTSWTQLSRRRLQNWGGLPHPNGMIQEAIPQWLQTCINKVVSLNAFNDKIPNHVLINEYKPNEGIMPHFDGPLYFPTIATVNLGSHAVLNFYKDEERDKSIFSLFLQPRSLLILQDEMYNTYLHGIEEKVEDLLNESVLNLNQIKLLSSEAAVIRGTRVSLTIRHVLKVSKFKLRLGQYK